MELGGELELTSCTHEIQLQLDAFFYEALVIAPPANSVFEMGVQDLRETYSDDGIWVRVDQGVDVVNDEFNGWPGELKNR